MIAKPPVIATAPPRESVRLTDAWKPAVALLAVVTVLLVGYLFDPTAHGFFPQCQFHQITGLNCPGCGATRAVHALAHGNWGAAFQNHALLVVALPFFLYGLVAELATALGSRRLPLFRPPPWCIWVGLSLLGIYTVLRNLPFQPFLSWAPIP